MKLNKLNKALLIAVSAMLIMFLCSYISSNKSEQCLGYCFSSINAEQNMKGYVSNPKPKNSNIFVIDYKSAFSIQSSEMFAEKVDRILAIAKKGDEVLINITSAGGATVSCGHDYDYVDIMKQYNLKVVVTVDYIAASCGYQLASSAHEIYASSGAVVGNIGAVFSKSPSMYDYFNKITGLENKVFGSTRTKELLVGDDVKSKEDEEMFRSKAERAAKDFYKRVLKGRGNRIDFTKIDKIFSADTFSGIEAKKLGLVDHNLDYRSYIRAKHLQGYNILRAVYIKDKTLIQSILGQ